MKTSDTPKLCRRSRRSSRHHRLHGDIQRRGDLVADQHLRLARQSPGDGDSLTFAARELAGIAIGGAGRQTHGFEEPSHHLVGVVAAEASEGRAGLATVDATVWRVRASAGFWKTIWIRRRCASVRR